MNDDAVTLAERYANATRSANLTPSSIRRCDADTLLAAGIAASGDPRRMLALSIYRLGVTGDTQGLYAIVEACDGLLAGQLIRKGNKPMPKAARQELVRAVLDWFMKPKCGYCEGTGKNVTEGTAGRMFTVCEACHGSGDKSLERCVPHAHTKTARWLAGEIEQHVAAIHNEMARLLATRMTL